MSYETENERIARIRDAQVQNRSFNTSKAGKSKKGAKKTSAVRTSAKPSRKNYTAHSPRLPTWNLWQLPPGGVRDVVIGFSYGLLPALFAVILLPDGWKLLAFVILGVACTTGYLLGDAPA
jgi:hypothetical protein